MIELRFNNSLNNHINDIILHNTQIIESGEELIVQYKGIDFKFIFNSDNPNITYWNFHEYTYFNEQLPPNIPTKYAIIIEGENYRGFNEAVSKYEILMSDNFTPNSVYLFTQTIFKWNKIAGIRWFREFKPVYESITPKYRFGYFIGRKTPFRVELGNLLTNHNFCFVNHWKTKLYYPHMKATQINDWIGNNDFDNLYKIYPNPKNFNFDLDYFFRVLPNVKVVLLDESHSDKKEVINPNFLTEKTFGLILANIPFIPTNVNTLKMIYEIIDTDPYPFEDEIREISANPTLINSYIVKFNQEFDERYIKIKNWTESIHNIVMGRLYSENSLLDYFIANPIGYSLDKINYRFL